MPAEPSPSVWAVARGQLVNPMNIMLLMVVAARTAGTVVLPGLPLPRLDHPGLILTWAAVELNMLQRLLDTTSLSGRD